MSNSKLSRIGRATLPAAALLLVASLVPAQCAPAQYSLSTGFAGGNGCSGNFFDVVAAAQVTVCSFDVHLGAGPSQTVEVWAVTGGGPYAPVVANPAAWTLLASPTVTGNGLNVATPLNLALQYTIPAGTTQGFIIRCTTSTNIDYTNGTTLGAVAAANADLTILQGQYTCTVGTTFPALTSAVRIFNGTIHYGKDNILAVGASAPGAGDLVVSLTSINPLATEGWVLLSFDTSLPTATGPFIGLVPDATTFQLLITTPLVDGLPLHFPIPSPTGSFPTIPFVLPPAFVPFPAGVTVDFATLLIAPGFTFVGTSGVIRYTF